jgi:hypothetical protein
MIKMAKMVPHDFYCMNCGKKTFELYRKEGFQHGRLHRKRLYCPYCRCEVNAIECKDYLDVVEFKENFANGVYKEEAEASIIACKESL